MQSLTFCQKMLLLENRFCAHLLFNPSTTQYIKSFTHLSLSFLISKTINMLIINDAFFIIHKKIALLAKPVNNSN